VRQAHYHFTVKGNQPTLERDIALLFEHSAKRPTSLRLRRMARTRQAHVFQLNWLAPVVLRLSKP